MLFRRALRISEHRTTLFSAMAGSMTTFKQMLAMTVANMRSRYRNSFAGLFWVLLNPLLMYGAQSFAFHYILKVRVPNYPVFLISGLLPWLFITQSLEMSTNILVTSGKLLKSFPIHPLVCLSAQIFDNFFNFVILVLVLVIAGTAMGLFPILNAPFLILPVAGCLTAVIGMAWILATLQIFFRDARFILTFVLNVSFFMTPIFYPENFLDEKFRWILFANPFRVLLLPFRDLIQTPVPMAYWTDSLQSLALGSGLVLVAWIYWGRKQNVAYFYL
jgi:lipopolysaccharide transport system permease protein